MDHLELLWLFRRYRLWYLALFVAASIAGGYYMIPKVMNYEGESTFYLANESLVNPSVFSQKGQQDVLQVNLVQERVYQLAYSNEMMNFLIKRFNLYDHYKIDTTRINYYARAVKRITQNIKFNKITTDLSSVVVTDRNNEIAANMANEIVWKLDQLNKKYLIDKIEANLNFYDSFVKESVNISNEQNKKLMGYMEVLSQRRHKPDDTGLAPIPMSEIEFSLYGAATKIEDITTQLILARNLYSNTLSAQKVKNLPSLVVIKRALPEITSKKKTLFILAALGGILSCVIALLLMYFYHSYRRELIIVFGKDLPETNP